MWSSLFLAQILGPIIIVVWFSLIFNEKFFKKLIKEMSSNTPIMYMWGLVSMFIGLYVLLTVENGWYLFQSILLVFGFLATLKWMSILLFPKYMKKFTKDMWFIIGFLKYFGVIYIVLGMYLCYAWYIIS